MRTQLQQCRGLRDPVCGQWDHVIPSPVLSREHIIPSRFRDRVTGQHDLGVYLHSHYLERRTGQRDISSAASKREPNTPLPSRSSRRALGNQGRAAAKDFEPDLWQLQEPLGPLAGSGGSDRRDDIDQALLNGASSSADPFEEQDDDPALADRRYRSIRSSASTSSTSSASSGGDKQRNGMGGEEATELIFKLEKYGSGWSEELFPRLTVEQRPIQKRIRVRNRSSFPDAWQAVPGRLWAPASRRRLPAAAALAPGRPRACGAPAQHTHARRHASARMRCRAYAHGHAPAYLAAYRDEHGHAGAHGQADVPEHWQGHMPSVEVRSQEGSAERYLTEVCGVPESAVDDVILRAVTWRVTAAGRPLIDRRHRSKAERNMPIVAAYLTDVCGIPPGAEGVGKVFQMSPCIMRCKPTQHDRWERRTIELAAYLFRHGHANVPEVYDPSPELGLWVRKQRAAKEQGNMSEERLRILLELGFEFGEEANITEEWELRFDLLMELLFMREEKLANGDIDAEAARDWVCMEWGAVGGPAAREAALWVQLQREFQRRNLLSLVATKRLETLGFEWEPKGGMEWQRRWINAFARLVYVVERGKKTVIALRAQEAQEKRRQLAQQTSLAGSAQASSKPRRPQNSAADMFEGLQPKRRTDGLAPAGVAAQRWLLEEMELRRAALGVTRMEPGQRAWLARQQRAWRRGTLLHEQVLLLALSGCHLELYDAAEWRQTAHDVAAYLMGCQIQPALGMPTRVMQESSEQLSQSSLSILDATSKRTLAERARSRPSRLLVDVPSAPALEREVSESKQAQLQRSQSSVALAQRPSSSSSSFDDGAFEAEEAPLSGAAAAWQDIVEAGALPKVAQGRPARVQSGTPPGRPPGWRMRVVRWVETQRQLWAEQRLNAAQLRYMTLLGITWVLSDQVVHMGDDAWRERYLHIRRICKETGEARVDSLEHPMALHDWLEHQKALAALGWLARDRERQLSMLGIDWRPDRAEADADWDARMTELLAFRRQQGHVQVVHWEEAPYLATWLVAVRTQWQQGKLAPFRVSQLTALGVRPMVSS